MTNAYPKGGDMPLRMTVRLLGIHDNGEKVGEI